MGAFLVTKITSDDRLAIAKKEPFFREISGFAGNSHPFKGVQNLNAVEQYFE